MGESDSSQTQGTNEERREPTMPAFLQSQLHSRNLPQLAVLDIYGPFTYLGTLYI